MKVSETISGSSIETDISPENYHFRFMPVCDLADIFRARAKQFLKGGIRKMFNACGFNVYRTRMKTSRTNLAELLDHVLRLVFSPQTVIDVGAPIGTFPLYEKFPDSRHLRARAYQNLNDKSLSIDFVRECRARKLIYERTKIVTSIWAFAQAMLTTRPL